MARHPSRSSDQTANLEAAGLHRGMYGAVHSGMDGVRAGVRAWGCVQGVRAGGACLGGRGAGAVCSWVDSQGRFLTASRGLKTDPLVARSWGGGRGALAADGLGRWWGLRRQSKATVKNHSQERLRRRLRGERRSLRGWGASLSGGGRCLWSPLSRLPRRFVARREPSRPGRYQAGSLLLATGLVRLDTAQSGMVVQAPPKRRGIRDNPGLWCGLGPPGEAQRRPGGACTRCGNSSHRWGCPGFPVASAGEAKQAGPVVSSR
ncbi:hypothetical protein ABIA35_005013 [Catenulispora sp. MAP12-49]